MKKGTIQVFLGCFIGVFLMYSHKGYADEKIPEWINNPQNDCQSSMFCSVGIGSTEKKADSDARSSLAKIFEAKVKSNFSSKLNSVNDYVSSEMNDFVSESVDVTVNNVEITKRFNKGETFYSFATLDKPKSAQMILNLVNNIDEEMKLLVQDGSNSSASKLEKMYKQRFSLNQQYVVLTGVNIPGGMRYEDIFKKKKSNKNTFFLEVKGTTNKSINVAVKKEFASNGIKFSKNKTSSRLFLITVHKKQMPFAISEMVKYSYAINISVENADGSLNEVMSEEFEGTGLTEVQAFDEAVRELKKYIHQNFDEFDF